MASVATYYALTVRIDLERAARALGFARNDDAFDAELVLLANTLREVGFVWEFGALYVYRGENGMAAVAAAVDCLRRIPWISQSIEAVHAYRLTDEADLTKVITGHTALEPA
jgi:virulence-associated protein VapD